MKQYETAYPNTAAIGHFVTTHLSGKVIENQPIEVHCSNKKNMQSIDNLELGIPPLPPHLKKATVFKETTRLIFSIPVLCDGGMEVTTRKQDVMVK